MCSSTGLATCSGADGASIIASTTLSGTPASLRAFNVAGLVSNLQSDDLILATITSAEIFALTKSSTSLFVNADERVCCVMATNENEQMIDAIAATRRVFTTTLLLLHDVNMCLICAD